MNEATIYYKNGNGYIEPFYDPSYELSEYDYTQIFSNTVEIFTFSKIKSYIKDLQYPVRPIFINIDKMYSIVDNKPYVSLTHEERQYVNKYSRRHNITFVTIVGNMAVIYRTPLSY